MLRASFNGASAARLVALFRSGARRLNVNLDANDDITFNSATGVAGSEVPIEALRIVNANGYVSVATRLGIGTAGPNTHLHNVNNTQLDGLLGVGTAVNSASGQAWVMTSTASRTAGRFEQTAANATAPVLIAKLGATPGAGGDVQQWQDNFGAKLVRISGAGTLDTFAASIRVRDAADTNNIAYLSSVGQIFVQPQAAGTVAAIVKGASGQTGDLHQWQDNGGGVLARIGATGFVIVKNLVAFQSYNAAGTTPYTLAAMDGADNVLIGNATLRTNIRTSEGVYTTGAPTLNGKITLTINGTTYNLATAA
jgi:hypothetical protein